MQGDSVTHRFCPECGTPAGDNNYCSECGFHLKESEPRDEGEARQAPTPDTPYAQAATTGGGGVDGGGQTTEADAPRAMAGDRPATPGIRKRWTALGTTARRSIVAGGALLVVVAVVAVVLATSGGGNNSPASNAGSSESGSNVSSAQSDAQVCAGAWNSEASQIDRQIASSFISGGGQAAAGYEASDPSLCLITFSRGTGAYAAIMQFNQEPGGGGFVQGAGGSAAQLPGNWVWNATVNSNGTVSASAPGTSTTTSPTTSGSGNSASSSGCAVVTPQDYQPPGTSGKCSGVAVGQVCC